MNRKFLPPPPPTPTRPLPSPHKNDALTKTSVEYFVRMKPFKWRIVLLEDTCDSQIRALCGHHHLDIIAYRIHNKSKKVISESFEQISSKRGKKKKRQAQHWSQTTASLSAPTKSASSPRRWEV
ncbi:hypothetical protein PoB_002207000 [Plakobranchus ocellatus]|uniref:Uncharacterized protein n=1 Tax=Plakobranchus ocellatus TaxID=259542 RepID=A0AAV3ZK93_9GAST|nr:hypothetical protein PoB_002207000 [Plakobranchus ocellatus]